MDKKRLEDMIKPSVMESFSEIHTSIDPLYRIRNSLSILEVAKQYEHMNSVSSVGEIARKAFQHSGLDIVSLENQSVISRLAQSQAKEAIILKGLSADAMKIISPYNNISQNLAKTMAELADPVAELMRPLLNISQSIVVAADLYQQSEFAKEFYNISQSQELSHLTLSISNTIIKFNEISQLESFKAISRLKNFPNSKTWTQDCSEVPEITESFIEEVKKIDASINDEISYVDDFNDLTENSQRYLETLNLSYYQIFIIHYIYILTILRDQISNSLKYSNMEFRFVGFSSKVLVGVCFISFQPDFNSICNSILATILLESIKKDDEK